MSNLKRVSTAGRGTRTQLLRRAKRQAKAIIDSEDIRLPTGELLEKRRHYGTDYAEPREILDEIDRDSKPGKVIMACILRG